jgi:pectin methylesterase-like acyl-CoA thioesterase
LLVALAATVEILLLEPQRAQQVQLARELTSANARLAQMTASASRLADDSDRQLHAREQAQQGRREHALKAIRAAHIDLIEPLEMGRQLAAILAGHPRLKIVAMQSNPAVTLSGVGAGTGAGTGTVPGATAGPGAVPGATAGIYEHELEVQVAGSYLDLIVYLRALELAPHRIYWRELDMKVDEQGVPVTRLTLFTLSKDATWLKL